MALGTAGNSWQQHATAMTLIDGCWQVAENIDGVGMCQKRKEQNGMVSGWLHTAQRRTDLAELITGEPCIQMFTKYTLQY
jgi:hypothetical protein